MATKLALAISLVANVVLVGVLVFADDDAAAPAPPSSAAKPPSACERVAADLDFFIEGLEKGNDAFYSPLVVRPLEPYLRDCLPAHRDELASILPALRQQLLHIIGHNVPDDVKRQAHDEALRLFRELRSFLGTGA